MSYKFGIDEMMTKINILKDEFTYIHDHSPIEHVKSRLKSADSVLGKTARKGLPLTLDARHLDAKMEGLHEEVRGPGATLRVMPD